MTPTRGAKDAPPLIAHVLFRFDVGGLENGLVNLINNMPADRYRHAVVSLTEHTDFAARIQRDDVTLVDIGKRPGKDWGAYRRLVTVLRSLRPRIVHTRNLGTLDVQAFSLSLGRVCRVHGEHGREISDVTGDSRKGIWLRRLHRPLVDRWVTVSRDLEHWLSTRVGVADARIAQIYNGVDIDRFHAAGPGARAVLPAGFAGPECVVVGSVGRLDPVKAQDRLARAFVEIGRRWPEGRDRLRWVHVGDGALRGEVEAVLDDAGLRDRVWLAGARSDVADLMRTFDVFALPSLGEGISNTVLEAMASGLPVVATAVGGNVELIDPDVSGVLVAPDDPGALADALLGYLHDPDRRARHGLAAHARVERSFSLPSMVQGYLSVYDELTGETRSPTAGSG